MSVDAAVQQSSSSPPRSSANQLESCQNVVENQTDHTNSATRDHRRRRRRRRDNSTWARTSSGNIHYRTDNTPDRQSEPEPAPRLPSPLIGPRRTRPHSIHVVSFPTGYVPRELRTSRQVTPSTRAQPSSASVRPRTSTANVLATQRPRLTHLNTGSSTDLPVRIAIARLFQSLSGNSLSTVNIPSPNSTVPIGIQALPTTDDPRASLSRRHSISGNARTSASSSRSQPDIQHRREHHHKDHRRREKEEQDRGRRRRDSSHQQNQPPPPRRSSRYYPPNSMTSVARLSPTTAHVVGHQNSFSSIRHAKSPISVVTEVPKPVATGSGVACSIILAERNLFLSGFDHDGHSRRDGQGGTALLRGKLLLTISKNVKIKAVQLKLSGRARTEWPEGIPPLKQETFEEEGLRTQVLTFFNALNDGWETEYGNQCAYRLKSSSTNSSSTNLDLRGSLGSTPSLSSRNNLTARELKKLSLQHVQSRSFGKGEHPAAVSTQAKGFKTFCPGTYEYSFELPIDHHQLETTKVPFGSVKWELHATVDRAGAFKPNLHGVKEVPIIRLPDQLSLEMSEPISISRQWEDQLHYDIMVSGKSFPIGAKIPIAFKLTPLAKVQVHKIKIYITESIEYWTNDRRVTRKDPGRKILLLEKTAGKPIDSMWASSEVNTISGGEPTAEARREAREMAQRRRAHDARRSRQTADPLPPPTDNILGDLDLGIESMWGSTEIEANVQIPTCQMMAKNKDLKLHPDCSWKNVNVFHWIKVVLRISRLDADDPTGTKRRHFEISIDSPLTILNCCATKANTYLPAYSNPVSRPGPYQSACGCPDSATVAMETSPNSSTGTLPNLDAVSTNNIPAPPEAAHLHAAANPVEDRPATQCSPSRPIHLLRAPSFSPPAFDADIAPPILIEDLVPTIMTPPPQYESVIGTPSVDGLADYFARLADYGYQDEESSSDGEESPHRTIDRSGRVNVIHPRTPGGPRLPSRSMEIARPPINLHLGSLPQRNGASRQAIRNET